MFFVRSQWLLVKTCSIIAVIMKLLLASPIGDPGCCLHADNYFYLALSERRRHFSLHWKPRFDHQKFIRRYKTGQPVPQEHEASRETLL